LLRFVVFTVVVGGGSGGCVVCCLSFERCNSAEEYNVEVNASWTWPWAAFTLVGPVF